MFRRTDADISSLLLPDGSVGELPWRFGRELRSLGNGEAVLEKTDTAPKLAPRGDPINYYGIAERFEDELPNLIVAARVLINFNHVPTPLNMHKFLKFRVTQESLAFLEEACVRGYMQWGMYRLAKPKEEGTEPTVKVRTFMVGRTVLAYYPTEEGEKFSIDYAKTLKPGKKVV